MKIGEFLLKLVVTIIVTVIVDALFAYPLMLLWNCSIAVLGGPTITFGQMFALSLLIDLLFSSKSVKSS